MQAYVVHVSATFFDRPVGDALVRPGARLSIDGSGDLPLPMPDGRESYGTVGWTGRRKAAILLPDGTRHDIGPDEHVTVREGPVAVTVRMQPDSKLRRSEAMPPGPSLAFLTLFLAISVTFCFGSAIEWCEWFGIACGAGAAAQGAPAGGAQGGNYDDQFTAEYLDRLLRKDYSGEDEGVVARRNERERSKKRHDSFYLPAGNEGPKKRMGGARDTAVRPVRAEATQEPVIVKKVEKKQDQLVAPEGVGVPILEQKSDDEPDDAVAQNAPAEEDEGWGIQDWYDAEDAEMDNIEIETMLRYARYRLRIDPNDPDALSILSYYQYLAGDFDAAIETYDKYIALYPESSAGYNNKALVYKRKAEYKNEEALYRLALTYAPDDYTALNNLAVNLAHQGRYSEALEIMRGLEISDPDDAYADLHRSKIHAEMGDDEKAYFYLDKALQGMQRLDTLHHIEFRQDIRVDPSFAKIRNTERFRTILMTYYGDDTPLPLEAG